MVSFPTFDAEATVLREPNYRTLLLATVFPILTTGLISPVLDSVIGPFGTTPARVGLLISVATAPAIVLIPLAGVLADRYGRKPLLVWSLVCFGLAGSAIAATTDFRVVLGLRFLQGVGFAGLVPTITTSIGDMYEGPLEATGQGLRMATNGLSGAILPLVAGALVALAWQFPFLLYALALPVAGIVAVGFTEPPASDAANTATGRAYLGALARLLARRHVAAVLVARALPVVVWIALLTYNSLIVSRLLGGTAFEAGLLAATGNVVFAVFGSQAGRITAATNSRFGPLLGGTVCLAGGFIAVVFAPGLPTALAGVTVAGAGFGVTLTLYRSLITGLADPALRGGLVSVGAAGARVTATATPVAMGVVLAVGEPMIGFAPALRLAGLGAAIVGGGGGLGCLLLARPALGS